MNDTPRSESKDTTQNSDSAVESTGLVSNLLKDDEGNQSLMRAMTLVCLGVAILLAAALVFYSQIGNPDQVENLALAFLYASVGGKAVQKFAETMKANVTRI